MSGSRSCVAVMLRLLLGCVLLSGTLAAAAETATFKLQVNPGEKWSFDLTTSVKQKGRVNANGQLAQPIDQSLSQHRKGTVEVLAVENGKPLALRVTYDAESGNSGNAGPQQAPPFALAGKTVTIRKGEGGNVSNDLPDQPDPQTLAELNHMLDPDTTVYPDHPVAVDDEWQGDTANVAKQFQLGADDRVSIKCKLLAIKSQDGRPVADVSIVANIVKHDEGFIETTTTLGGVSRVDLKSGQTLTADLIGKMSSHGSKQVQAPNGQPVALDVQGDGTLEVHQRVNQLEAGQAGATPPTGTMRDASPAQGNPLALASGNFAGSYKGDGLVLEISGDPTHYSGTLELKDNKFPVSAHAAEGKLVGTFESEGNKFDFTASLDSGTLTLVSGGTTYTLKKAVANPLGKPAAKNPLSP
ncbi:MAG TPA: hypothetical protein VLJ39_14480 [Tepidisphaeraceae bacterium]|nr:hypothetical protein [Tepidisphaeraceae bacterium]